MDDGHDTFLESLMEDMLGAIETPGVPCAREEFVVHKPDDMNDAEWTDWCKDLRFQWNDPAVRAAAVELISSSTSA